ncbi:hypothetical protein CBM2585_B20172 [Cupriavidus taiwanensis]|nr:hypothetical protein CBM2585_B20172 [Cupriavidus taiwanensis]SPC20381.1 hypothetical protein CT19431_MP80231 [Cupriavidus taiwanensis]
MERAAAIMHERMARGPQAVHAQLNATIKNQGIH